MDLSKFKGLVLSCAAAAAFVGCGSSDSGTTAPVTQTGTFVDAPVQGLKFATATQNGFTNDKGEYKFVNGEQVEFSLGNLSFGKVAAQALVTPYTMAGDTDITNPSTKAQNIAMLLQNLDQNRTNTGVLVINALFADYDFSDVNLSDAALESSMHTLLAVQAIADKIDPINNSAISAADAVTNMETYLTENSLQYDKKFTQEYLNGKTFYVVSHWDSEGWITLKNAFHNDGTFSYYDAPDANATVDYAVTTDGRLKIMSRDSSDPIVYATIKSVTDQCIEVNEYIESTATSKSTNSYLCFDQAKADAKLASLQSATISVAGGFGAEWLNNRMLWLVINNKMYRFEFNNNKESIFDITANTYLAQNMPYTVDETGRLKVDESGQTNGDVINPAGYYQYYQITGIDGSKISTISGDSNDLDSTGLQDIEHFYTNQADAQAYLAELNSLSVADGFSAEWLEGRVLYEVILDTQDDDNDGSTTDWLVIGSKYENGRLSYDFSADGSYEVTTGVTYSIVNGTLVMTEGTDVETETITAIDATKITTNLSASWGGPDETVYAFFNKADAQAYVNTLP